MSWFLCQIVHHCNTSSQGVYDVTEFIAEHPGGDKLLIGAGGPIEPFWSLYAVHKKPYVSFQLPNYKFVEYSCFIKAIHYEVEFPAVID